MSPKVTVPALLALLTASAAFAMFGSSAVAEPAIGGPRAAVVASPKTRTEVPASRPADVKLPASKPFDPALAFNDLGCSGCHGEDGIFRDEVKGALGKPVEDVARWIRNAPSIKPDTDMPSFEKEIDEPSAMILAHYMLQYAANLK